MYPTEAADWEIDNIAIINTVTGLTDLKASDETILIYPNPADYKGFYINFKDEIFSDIKIYNNLGLSVKEISGIFNDKKIHVDTGGLPDGLYFIEMIQPAKRYISKVIIIH